MAGMGDDTLLRGALRAVAGPPLGLIAVATVVFVIGDAAGLLGIPALLIGASWVWTYTYLLVAATAHGLPLPVLAIENANPWHEPRPLLQLALLASAASLASWLAQHVGAWAAAAVGILSLFAFPASLALLAVEGDAVRALSPLAIGRVVAGLGVRYVALLALGAADAALVIAVGAALPHFVAVALGQLLLYSLATALGTALYARRHELGLDAWHGPEHAAARDARAAEHERAAIAAEMYGLIRARHVDVAWARAAAWLAAGGRDPHAVRWLRDRTLSWNEQRFTDRLTEELVVRLIALGRRGEALDEVEACWRRGGNCVPANYRDRDVLEGVARELRRDAALERLKSEHSAGHAPG
jgi:hypothetical protein